MSSNSQQQQQQERTLIGVEWKRLEPCVALDTEIEGDGVGSTSSTTSATSPSNHNNSSVVFTQQQVGGGGDDEDVDQEVEEVEEEEEEEHLSNGDKKHQQQKHVEVNFVLKSPSSRYMHSCVLINNETEVFIFGGYSLDSVMNDVYIFNIQREEWRKIETTEKNNNSDNVATARYGHSTVAHNGKVYIFGGKAEDRYLNDLIVFDCQTMQWTNIPIRPANKKPREVKDSGLGGRAYHSAVIYRDCMYVFGGSDDDTIFNELIQINLQTGKWKQLNAVENYEGPSARDQHTAVIHEETMYVFGGISEDVLNDFWQYHIPSNKWSPVAAKATLSSFKPTERSGHASGICGNNLIIAAGEDPNTMKHYDDIYAFNIPAQEWVQMKQKGSYNPTAHARAAFTHNKIFMFGGYHALSGPNDDFTIGSVKPIRRQQQQQQQQQQQ